MMYELFDTDWRSFWHDGAGAEPVGAVYTKPQIVELILDLAGYTPSNRDLARCRLLEPSCGDGAFLSGAVNRLIESEKRRCDRPAWGNADLQDAIRACDISAASVDAARRLIVGLLTEAHCPEATADHLAAIWVVHTDFLLTDWSQSFDFVIGNPPYVRIEHLPKRVLSRYRELYQTLTDRADIYVAFVEKGLRLLSPHGSLAFICANRFAKNKYGQSLRLMIAGQYRVRHYLNLEHTQPFATEVSAYPAVVVIDRHKGQPTNAGTLADIEPQTLALVRSQALDAQQLDTSNFPAPWVRRVVSSFPQWYTDGEPWVTTSTDEHGTLAELNDALSLLEESAPGTKVGIGVATGADNVFVLETLHKDIEESRQIPMLMAADVRNDAIRWSGRFLLNPFDERDDGSLISTDCYPGATAYLFTHKAQLIDRHVARNRPNSWYRTIDRIWPALQHRPKLVIPDIQVGSVIGYDEGEYYPHHNLYWITSDTWPLRALKTLLRSDIVYQQVKAYSVQMRGGSVRFQAQTLRRLRIPRLADISDAMVERLTALAESDSSDEINEVVREVFLCALATSRGD